MSPRNLKAEIVPIRRPDPPAPPPPLTNRQAEIIGHIAAFIRERGYAPSIRDLQRLTGIASQNGITCHLKALQKKGRLVWDANLARSIRLVGPRLGAWVLPLGGQVLSDGSVRLDAGGSKDAPAKPAEG